MKKAILYSFLAVSLLFGNVGISNATTARTAEITAPTAGQEVSGEVTFEAYLSDGDIDGIQWAIRQGTCAANTNTVFGNVDQHNDVASIDTSDVANQTFSFTADMSALEPGMYCFVYNPTEDSGETEIRETREFQLTEVPETPDEPEEPAFNPPTDKNECKKDGWMSFNSPTFRNQGDCVSYVQSNEHAEKGNKKDNK